MIAIVKAKLCYYLIEEIKDDANSTRIFEIDCSNY
jgi:hypothetical protein